MLLFAFAIDSFGSLWRAHGLMERAQFFYWIQTSPAVRAGLGFWLVFAFLAGASQLVLQAQLGRQELLLETYGAVYSHVQSGEIWRVLVGPLFHSGPLHFFNNLLLLSFVGPLTWAVLRPMSALVLFIGYPIGMLAQMYFGGGKFDSFLGISSGVFALFGLLIGSAALDRSLWPKGFALLSAWIAVISIFAADVVSDRAATTAHIVGFAFGVLVAFLCAKHPAAGNRSKASAKQRQH